MAEARERRGRLWVPIAGAAIAVTWVLARTRYAWLAGSVAVILALPRFIIYEIGFVLVGLAGRSFRRTARS